MQNIPKIFVSPFNLPISVNNSISLSGTGQYGKIINFPELDSPFGLTFEAWFYNQTNQTYTQAFEIGQGAFTFARMTTENNPTSEGVNFRCAYTGAVADGYATGGVFTANTWVHVAFSNSGVAGAGGKTKIYRNGVEISYSLQNTPSGTFNKGTGGNEMFIGAFMNLAKPWKGRIANVRLWNYGRSAAEILANKDLYLSPPSEPGLIVNVPMNEGTGNVAKNTARIINPCVFVGSPSWNTGPTLTVKKY